MAKIGMYGVFYAKAVLKQNVVAATPAASK